MKVLIIDDEELIRDVIKEYCNHENFETLEAENGIEALEILKKNFIDVIVLDIMMPKMDGYTFFKEMKENYNIPTIVVSARNDEYDKLQGFALGIDDYLTKPFSPRELIARIKAITKRYQKEEDIYEYKTLRIDFKAHVLTIDDEEVKITLKEYEILKYFVNNKNIAIPRDELLNKIWGYDFYGDDRTIDTHVKMLRANLGKYRDMIETIRGVGYKFLEK
ncbi:MAG: response regulator transcription factor [Bacilli bacterium]|nr:response regulator transcription factor [Bacilli bacterium]